MSDLSSDDEKQLEQTIRQTLTDRYSFAQRDFGQAVSASNVVAAIHSVEGVLAVELDALYLHGASQHKANLLPASLARWDNTLDTLVNAQLLLINPNTEQSITLTLGNTL